MNQTTEALANAIEESKALYEVVKAHVRFAELCDDPHTALKHWLEALAWYFLDDEFLEEN